jgi:hypothetical protein
VILAPKLADYTADVLRRGGSFFYEPEPGAFFLGTLAKMNGSRRAYFELEVREPRKRWRVALREPVMREERKASRRTARKLLIAAGFADAGGLHA